MIPETYAVFAAWELSKSKRENLDHLRRENYLGLQSAGWLRDVAKVINRRFDPSDRDRALVILAQAGTPLDEWKPILLWHITRDEFLLRDFLIHWLYPLYEAGTLRVHPEELDDYLLHLPRRGGVIEHEWSEATRRRVAAGLLRAAVDFGLLRGSHTKEFASYYLPERSFLYVLHALSDDHASPARILASPDWRLYQMDRDQVERELLRLHQFKKLEYEVAGTLLQLSMPDRSALEYAETM